LGSGLGAGTTASPNSTEICVNGSRFSCSERQIYKTKTKACSVITVKTVNHNVRDDISGLGLKENDTQTT
jgi:hypothetical protein